MIGLVIAVAATTSVDLDPLLSKNAARYDEICLKAFPDDKAVESIMAAQHATPLTPEEVKVTMRDDPARGWELQDGTSVWIEFPPYHACSVRWNAPGIGDLSAYRALADRYEQSVGGFSGIAPYDADISDIHVHAVGEQRALADGGTESLFFFDQHITDSKRRAAGETGFVVRFVHQYHLNASQ